MTRSTHTAVALGLVAAILAAGCANRAPQIDGTPAACPAATLDGVLEELGSGIGVRDGQRILEVDWPDGFSTAIEADGRLVLVGPTGLVEARVGDRALLAGGEIRPGTWFACPDPVIRVIEGA